MRKLVLLAHTSLDGFVAGINGELDDFDASEETVKYSRKVIPLKSKHFSNNFYMFDVEQTVSPYFLHL